jgi:hypothetical protein
LQIEDFRLQIDRLLKPTEAESLSI